MDAPENSMLDLVSAHGLRYGREDSFKMSRGRLLADRFLLGIRRQGVPDQALLDIAAGIGMPTEYRSLFLAGLSDADVVLFGQEDGETGLIYKAYLEFWEKVRREVRATGSKEPTLLNLGFKWRAGDNPVNVISRYTCFPMLDLAEMLRRIKGIYGAGADQPSCRIALHLVQLAASRNAASIYMEVGEEGTPRRSYDINLYKAHLTLASIEPVLRNAASQYALPGGQFDALYSGVRGRLLGHLSGGVARDGSDFLTVYYETQAL
jgi:tryptophan halogenase